MSNHELREDFLGFVRLMIRAQRLPAVMADGSPGNVMEQAFLKTMIWLWRCEHGFLVDRDDLAVMCAVEPLALHARRCPEDRFDPGFWHFREEIAIYDAQETLAARLAASDLQEWVNHEVVANPGFAMYLKLMQKVRAERRDVPVAGRPSPEADENDAEHSAQLALACVHFFRYTAWKEMFCPAAELVIDAMCHDVIEGYSRDTPAAGRPDLLATKEPREVAALEKINQQFPWLGRLILDYQLQERRPSRLVKSLDKVMALAMIGVSGGATWERSGFSYWWQLRRMLHQVPLLSAQELGTDLAGMFELVYWGRFPAMEGQGKAASDRPG